MGNVVRVVKSLQTSDTIAALDCSKQRENKLKRIARHGTWHTTPNQRAPSTLCVLSGDIACASRPDTEGQRPGFKVMTTTSLSIDGS